MNDISLFGRYQRTKNNVQSIREIQPHWDFPQVEPYRTIIKHQLTEAIYHLEDLRRELQKYE